MVRVVLEVRLSQLLFLVFLLINIPFPVFGDGKIYGKEIVPPDIDHQRGVIFHDGTSELVILQNKFQGRGKDFGWVIPLPSEPLVFTLKTRYASTLFRELNIISRARVYFNLTRNVLLPLVIFVWGVFPVVCFLVQFFCGVKTERNDQESQVIPSVSKISRLKMLFSRAVFYSTVSAVSFVIVLPIMICFFPSALITRLLAPVLLTILAFILFLLTAAVLFYVFYEIPRRSYRRYQQLKSLQIATWKALIGTFWFVLPRNPEYGMAVLIIFFLIWGAQPQFAGVSVNDLGKIGIYEAKIISSDNGKEVVDWLKRNDYKFHQSDEAVFSDYTRQGFCFLTVRLANPQQKYTDDLTEPLCLLFQSQQPFYPMRLTALAGREIDLLLYLFSDSFNNNNYELPLEWCGVLTDYPDEQLGLFNPASIGSDCFLSIASSVDHEEQSNPVFSRLKSFLNHSFRCGSRFRGTVRSDQMSKDLVFTPSSNQQPFRQDYKFSWFFTDTLHDYRPMN